MPYGLDWTGLDWTGLDWTGLDWTGLDWTGLDCPLSSNWTFHFTYEHYLLWTVNLFSYLFSVYLFYTIYEL